MADCALLNPAANGECGAMSNPNFGKTINPLTVDPDTTSGWNKREYSWDLTAGVTQEIAPRVSLEVDYIRRTWGNLQDHHQPRLDAGRLRHVHLQRAAVTRGCPAAADTR